MQLSPTSKDHNIGQFFLRVALHFQKSKHVIHFLKALIRCSTEWVPAKSVNVKIIY